MRFKATSYGVNLGNGPSTQKDWCAFYTSSEEAIMRATDFLRGLTEAQQKTAYVKVVEIKDVLIAEIHTAAEKINGELIFAIANMRELYR